MEYQVASKNILAILLMALHLLGCQSAKSLSTLSGRDNSRLVGYFVNIPTMTQVLSIDQHGEELFYGISDVPTRIIQCNDPQFVICAHAENKNMAFVVPTGEIRNEDNWTYLDYSFKVVEVLEGIFYIDVQLPTQINDSMRFFYRSGSVLGFAYGTHDDSCSKCFNARITYLWSGNDSFPPLEMFRE